MQDEERAFLAKAKCISVAMDERKDRLLVTYAACRGTAVRSGVLAQLRSPGRSAAMTAACVAAAARRLCTIRKPHHHMNKTRKAATIDSTTLQRILDHVEMFSADGAANEQVAGRLLHPLVQRASRQAAKLKNLKMVLRDKAHACRRLLSRTVVVDPELKAINDIMLFGTPSIAKMLRDSRPCAEIFEQVLKDQRQPNGAGQVPGGAASPKHLGYAKQRFDNSARPHRHHRVGLGRDNLHVRHHLARQLLR